jgi:Uma2 family endonuclease
MQWSEVIASPYLQDLPFKIELNRYGKIEMSPASNQHNYIQIELAILLRRKLKKGKTFSECSIATTEGVKVADVVWCSNEFIKQHGFTTPYLIAPEICIEVVSPSNSKEEMYNKVKLYLAAGAKEVWIYWENDKIEFFNLTGQIEQSGYGVTVKLPK